MNKTITKLQPSPDVLRRQLHKRVAAYARVSTDKHAMLHSLSAQVTYYSNLIQSRNDWEYKGVYTDEALTGTKDNRHAFQRMIDDCRNGHIDMIITKAVSRFARNTVTLLETVRELKSLGVDVYFEEERLHSLSGEGELMLTILASYAQEESLSASENQKWRIRKAFENGELINLRFLYGYIIRNGLIEINPHQAETVRYIFDAFLSGASMTGLAREMTERGETGELGGKWCEVRIRDILTNEKYTGNALLQKKYRNNHLEKKLLRNKGELPRFYAEGTHDAIIDSDTFERVQQRLTDMKKPAKPMETSVFTGLLECARCGRNYKRCRRNGTVGWNCSTYLQDGRSACPTKKIPEATLVDICNEILGITTFDEEHFRKSVSRIIVPEPNKLIFIMSDGKRVERRWSDRSRSLSWTDEMRRTAYENQRRIQLCQE